MAVDGDGLITYANPRVRQTFGYEPDELIGQPMELLVPDRVAHRHVELRNGFMARPVARPMGIGHYPAGRRKDAAEFPVEIGLSAVETVDGLQVYATVVDITARKSAEAALAESEHRFRAVLEASPNAIVGVDEDGIITHANPRVEATFGHTREAVIGRPLGILIPDHLRERHESHRERYKAAPVARPIGIGMELVARRSDGTDFPVEISLWPVDIDEGRQVFATVVDISARKAAETELLQAQKLESIGRLAGGIAHDFNNMLFAISGYADLLDQDLAPENGPVQLEVARRNVIAIREAAVRAADLTSQLLAFSRQQVVIPRVVDVNAAIRALEPMLQPLIGENVHLTLRLDADQGRIRADQGQLDQMLVNLVVNARDAMPGGGDVSIETSDAVFAEEDAIRRAIDEPGRYVLVAVSDTGVGMDRATRERVFEPFFTTKELGKGTGLGLATIYGIVHQAGGRIRVYSEPDKGWVFRLYFPAVSEEVSEEPPAPPSPASVGAGTILLVEDEPAVRDMTTQRLRRSGYTVTAVSDAAEALAEIESGDRAPDALVTDVLMPGMSGMELAERFLERYPGAGIVLLSGYTAETLDLERLIRRGAVFIAKPASTSELLAAITRVIGRRLDEEGRA